MKSDVDKIDRALSYPFAAPSKSYVLMGEEVLDLVSIDTRNLGESVVRRRGTVRSLAEQFERQTGRAFEAFKTVPILASGSNASPVRLKEKFAKPTPVVIPVLLGTVHHLCPVYSAHVTRYGSISATLQWAESATARLFCLLLPASLLEVMHRSEFVGTNYGYFQLRDVVFKSELDGTWNDPFAYLSLWGGLSLNGIHARLTAYESRGVDWPSLTQRQVMAEVHALLETGQAFEEFVLSNIADDNLRKQRIRYLSQNHAMDIDQRHFHRSR